MSTYNWNPWHGCTKISPGCEHCYVYRMDKRYGRDPEYLHRIGDFEYPLWTNRHHEYKIPSNSFVLTCFTSDFLHPDADQFRDEAWRIIRTRSDCHFLFITKRIDRFMKCIPEDWGDGYDNVTVTCTCENQKMADYRLEIFKSLPIKSKSICLEPLLEYVDITKYLDDPALKCVISGGESGSDARICDYKWVQSISEDCHNYNVPFCFKQSGARFLNEDGVLESVARYKQYDRVSTYLGNINDYSIDNLEEVIL